MLPTASINPPTRRDAAITLAAAVRMAVETEPAAGDHVAVVAFSFEQLARVFEFFHAQRRETVTILPILESIRTRVFIGLLSQNPALVIAGRDVDGFRSG